jgi:anti-sigma regulatory factor (Ser/Thr protein kinase)
MSTSIKQRRKPAVAVLADLLLQPYRLDPGAIEFLIEEASRDTGDGPVLVACSLLGRSVLSSLDRENLADFVSRASATESTLRAFGRSLKRKGRCPSAERAWLRAHLSPKDTHPKGSPELAQGSDTDVLDLRDLSGALGEFHRVIDRLGGLRDSATELQVKLGDFTYAAALAAVAQWILAHHLVNRYDFAETSDQMLRYLEDIRFSAALRNPEIVISPDPMDWAVGLTRINRNQPTERVTEKIVDILHTFVNPTPDNRQALAVLVSEMIENVHRHAQSPVDGFAVAQVYPKQLKMGITLVDAGIGVRASFERGEPSVDISRLHSDGDFLREAVKLYSTSKRRRHSGYGLFLFIGRNRGTFLLSSGGATLVGYQRSRQTVFDAFAHRPWRGTIVSVIIDLSRELPLLEIYREMPLPQGYQDDDLFI